LTNYTRLELAPGGKDAAMYLWDRSNRQGTKLMTKARLGHMLLMQNIARVRGWPASKAVCVMCKSGVEDVTHFLLHCKVLAPCRERFVRSLAASLESAGLPGRFVLQRVQQGIKKKSTSMSQKFTCWRKKPAVAFWDLKRTNSDFLACSYYLISLQLWSVIRTAEKVAS